MKRFIIATIFIIVPINLHAKTLTFNDVYTHALKNSYDIQLLQKDINLSKHNLEEVKSLFYPQLNLQANSEFSDDLDADQSEVISIGDTVYGDDTLYQSSVSLALNNPLFSYGIRHRQFDVASADVRISELTLKQQENDFGLTILDIYTKALLLYGQIKSNKEILQYRKRLNDMTTRLYAAGKVSRIALAEEVVNSAVLEDEIISLETQLSEVLNQLSYYTKETYNGDEIKLDKEHISSSNLTLLNDQDLASEDILVNRIYNTRIHKQKANIEITQKSNWPTIDLYSKYTLYGSDRKGIADTIYDMTKTNLVIGISSTLPVFDGFKNHTNINKQKEQLAKLKLQKEQTIYNLIHQYNTQVNKVKLYDKQIVSKKKLLSRLLDNITYVDELSQQKLVDQTRMLRMEIDYIKSKHELEKLHVNKWEAVKRAKLLFK